MTIIFLGDGLTVFAPTNAAFNKLGSHVLDNLRRDPQLLKGIVICSSFYLYICGILQCSTEHGSIFKLTVHRNFGVSRGSSH